MESGNVYDLSVTNYKGPEDNLRLLCRYCLQIVHSAQTVNVSHSQSAIGAHWSWALKLEHRAAIDFFAFTFRVPGTRAEAVVGHSLLRYQTVVHFARVRMGNLKRAVMVEYARACFVPCQCKKRGQDGVSWDSNEKALSSS